MTAGSGWGGGVCRTFPTISQNPWLRSAHEANQPTLLCTWPWCLNPLVNNPGFGNPVNHSTRIQKHLGIQSHCSSTGVFTFFWFLDASITKVSFQLKWNLPLHPISPILSLGTRQKRPDAYFTCPIIRYLMTIFMSSQTLFISRLYSNNGNNVNIYCAFSVPGTVQRALHILSQGWIMSSFEKSS